MLNNGMPPRVAGNRLSSFKLYLFFYLQMWRNSLWHRKSGDRGTSTEVVTIYSDCHRDLLPEWACGHLSRNASCFSSFCLVTCLWPVDSLLPFLCYSHTFSSGPSTKVYTEKSATALPIPIGVVSIAHLKRSSWYFVFECYFGRWCHREIKLGNNSIYQFKVYGMWHHHF